MIGTYNIDQKKVDKFYKLGLRSTFITVGIVWLFFMLLILLNPNSEERLILTFVITVACLLVIGIWMAKSGNTPNFETTQIIIENDRIIRKGKGLITVRIRFQEIGRIFSHRNAIVIVRKGVLPLISYYIDRFKFISNMDILYIPSMIESFESIKSYIEEKRK
jgi:hypothetical protein